MNNEKIYDSDILAAIHETASDLHSANLLDESIKKEFDEICLTPIKSLKPAEIRAIRLEEDISEEVFAKYLNVSPHLIRQWESGKKKPQGSSLKLLSLVKKKGISLLV
ncbi:helix-turn-helix domain-containing protein [Geminocystis sp. CENA526]|uniref:helix-turn-helix domain-containing protein n=1 Tax=Geminocystis sp. CENA526 TaxID=1355871 RepID=UPI003D6E1240